MLVYITTLEGADYTAPDPLEVTFPAGIGNSASVSGCVPLQDNSIEGDHSFAVALDSVQVQFMNNVFLDTNTVEITILDDDGKSMTFIYCLSTIIIILMLHCCSHNISDCYTG